MATYYIYIYISICYYGHTQVVPIKENSQGPDRQGGSWGVGWVDQV